MARHVSKRKRLRTGVRAVATLMASFVVIAALASPALADHGGSPSTNGVQPVVIPGNPHCQDVAPGTTELYIDPVVAGTYSDGTIEFSFTVFNERFLDWASNLGVDAVIVKGGPDSNVYLYDPEATRDGSLHAPINHKNNEPYGLSHLSVCYDIEAAQPRCTGQAFDVRLDLAGTPAEGFLGPAIRTDPDVFPDREVLSEVALTAPGATQPALTARTLVAENSGDPSAGCKTQFQYEDADVNLNNVGPGIPVTISADAIRTTAVAQVGGGASTNVQILGLVVNGQVIGDISPAPNTTLVDLGTLGVPGLSGRVVLHDQSPIPGGLSANAIRVQVFLVNSSLGTNQALDLKVAHAEADAHAS